MRKGMAAFGLVAGLATGGAAGFALTSTSPFVSAQDGTATTRVAAPDRAAQPDPKARLQATLQPLVDDGTLTQAQADKVIDALIAARGKHADGAPNDGPEGHRGPARGRFGMPRLEAAATALGMNADELGSQLRSGTTIKDIAASKGIDPQAVIDAVIADQRTRIDQAVKDGRITQAQADERIAEMTSRITAFVNGDLPPKPLHDPPADGPAGR